MPEKTGIERFSMRFWLEYDWIALAVLIFGLAAVVMARIEHLNSARAYLENTAFPF
jgi:hypothetical protein